MPDCGCVIEVTGLDRRVTMDDDGSVHYKKCPKCSTPILTGDLTWFMFDTCYSYIMSSLA
jgi:hypothetical protein